jgi:hypothetical protein
MKSLYSSPLVLILLAAAAGAAYGTQPTDVVTSDTAGNTAMGTRRYGLIAEEVAKVYPELVIRDQSGRISGVRYDALAQMLLNEMQQQRAQMAMRIDIQAEEIRSLKEDVAELKELNQERLAVPVTAQR